MGFEYVVLMDGWLKLPVGRRSYIPNKNIRARLMLGLNQLLVRISGKTILVDVGLGEKCCPEDMGLVDYQHPRGLIGELLKNETSQDDVDIVILSHLHYDHSGGSTHMVGSKLAPTFTNAIYYLQSAKFGLLSIQCYYYLDYNY